MTTKEDEAARRIVADKGYGYLTMHDDMRTVATAYLSLSSRVKGLEDALRVIVRHTDVALQDYDVSLSAASIIREVARTALQEKV